MKKIILAAAIIFLALAATSCTSERHGCYATHGKVGY